MMTIKTSLKALMPKSISMHISKHNSFVLSVIVFGLLGAALYINTRAATPTAKFEAENAVLLGGATVANDVAASNSQAVQFNASPTQPPAPPPPTPPPVGEPGTYKPNATNTGVPAGTSLTIVNGDLIVTTAGTVVDARDVRGFIIVRASNVTIKRSIVRGRSTSSNGAYIKIESGTGTIIEDSEIAPTSPLVYLDGITGSNFTARRLNIHGGVDGIKAGSNSRIEASYIHDMTSFSSDPNQGGGATHNDAIQILSGTNLTLLGNTLIVARSQNAAVQITQDFGQVRNVTIDKNWVDGGGCTLNISHNNGPVPMTQIFITNNKFGRNSFFNCPILYSTQTQETASNNTYEDNGQAVVPQRHD